MKINNYYFFDDTELHLARAVNEAMVLFRVEPVNEVTFDQDGNVQLLPDTVQIYNKVLTNEQVEVTTEVLYYQGNTKSKRLSRRTAVCIGEDRRSAIKRLVRLNLLHIMREITGYNPGPWGILRGIRPTKIVHRLLDAGLTKSEAAAHIADCYSVDSEKAGLVTDVAIRQRPFLTGAGQAEKTVSVYIGIPYCPSRCLYCSFPSAVIPKQRETLVAFLQALEQDINAAAQLIATYNLKVQTVYVGGGTPTSLNCEDFSRLLDIIKKTFITADTREFTVEAGRPDSVDDAKLEAMCRYGVTRVSINPQTMQEKTLKHIGRMHTVQDIISVFKKIRYAGIPVINMDIIAGLPGENENDMADTIRQITELEPDNLTIHTLAVKKGSLLKEDRAGHNLPDEQTTASMLAIAHDSAYRMGMFPYYLYRQKYMTGNLENVGFSKSGLECLYNIQIMEERQTIIGVGPAAVTKAVDVNTWRLASSFNAKDIKTYINNLEIYLKERERLLANLFAYCKED